LPIDVDAFVPGVSAGLAVSDSEFGFAFGAGK